MPCQFGPEALRNQVFYAIIYLIRWSDNRPVAE